MPSRTIRRTGVAGDGSIRLRSLLVLAVAAIAFLAGYLFAPARAQEASGGDGAVPTLGPTTTAPQPGRALAEELSTLFESAASKVSPAVVPIYSQQEVHGVGGLQLPDDALRQFFGDDLTRRFFGQLPNGGKQTVRGLGSGVIVSPEGYVLTNNHVVAHADKVTVELADKRRVDAKVIGTDPQTDVAVIRIEAKDLQAAHLGDSNGVKVGQWVIAVGNPFQLMHTVTSGIISAKGRSNVGLADYEDFIQTDASINPGNSGGALADLDGNVIGINTAIGTPTGGNVGIGFAIPIDMAKDVMDKLIRSGKVVRGYLGVGVQDIDENMAKALSLPSTEGALVGDVTKDGPAAKAGIERGDVIVEIDGNKIHDSTQLRNTVASGAPGRSANVVLLRKGDRKSFSVTLAERPKDLGAGSEENDGEESPESGEEGTSAKLGLEVQRLTPDIAKQLGYESEKGVVVANVTSGGPASDAGLRRGDLIQEVNRKPISDPAELRRAVRGAESGSTLALLVRRGENTSFVAVKVP